MSPVHLEKKESGLKKSRLSFNIITFVISILCWGQFIHKHRGKEKPRDSQARQTATQQRIQNTILISFLPWWRTSHANGMKSNKKKTEKKQSTDEHWDLQRVPRINENDHTAFMKLCPADTVSFYKQTSLKFLLTLFT